MNLERERAERLEVAKKLLATNWNFASFQLRPPFHPEPAHTSVILSQTDPPRVNQNGSLGAGDRNHAFSLASHLTLASWQDGVQLRYQPLLNG
jgi:hypothetical protein